MKLFEVLFLFESDDLFSNKEQPLDVKQAKVKLTAIAKEQDHTTKGTPRFEQLQKMYDELNYIINPKAYAKVLKDPRSAYQYARDVRAGRFYAGEDLIIEDPFWASLYASDIIKGRWPEAEHSIKTDAQAAHNYIDNIIKERWPEAEPALYKGAAVFSFPYIKQYIKKRVPEVEHVMLASPYYAFEYAKSIIKGRWPEAEAIINSSKYKEQYADFLKKQKS